MIYAGTPTLNPLLFSVATSAVPAVLALVNPVPAIPPEACVCVDWAKDAEPVTTEPLRPNVKLLLLANVIADKLLLVVPADTLIAEINPAVLG